MAYSAFKYHITNNIHKIINYFYNLKNEQTKNKKINKRLKYFTT